MIKYQFFLGTDTNGHGGVNAIHLAYELAGEFFPNGHSIREEEGRWMSQSGPVDEVTVVVTWLAADHLTENGEADRLASRFAGAYKVAAYQESVLVERQTVDAFLV